MKVDRRVVMLAQNATSKEDLETAQTTYTSAVADHDAVVAQRQAAEDNLKVAQAQLSVANSLVAANQAQVTQYTAALQSAQIDLDHTSITAPVDGASYRETSMWGRLGSGGVATLTSDDAKAIVDECPSVALTAPTVRGGVQVVYGSSNWATVVQGVTPDYMTLRDYTMMSGQFFTTQAVDASAKLAVLGETVAQNLFGDSDPTGQVVTIKNVPFMVSGVLTPKG